MSNAPETGSEPIPGYRLIEPLGRGGFGEVWKAEAPGGLEKAVKFVYGSLTGETSPHDPENLVARELKGLNRMRSVRHPFILSVERFDIVEGRLFIIMELADRDLQDRFEECRKQGLSGIPRQELLKYLSEAAEALDLMNSEFELQHLDIKPTNLFLVHNHVKVADFGLAKDLDGFSASLTSGTTPVYAAPETFQGKATRHTDQYSLAIVYQEMLTGRRPFKGDSAAAFMLMHLTKLPNLSSLPEHDRSVVGRTLSKEPTKRFPSCTDFIEALLRAGNDPVPTEVSQDDEVPVAGSVVSKYAITEKRPSAESTASKPTEIDALSDTLPASPSASSTAEKSVSPSSVLISEVVMSRDSVSDKKMKRKIQHDIFADEYKVPEFSKAATNILRILEVPNIDLPTLQTAIELEPAIATRLIRLSNSAFFAQKEEVTSISQAVVILGLQKVRQLTLSCSLLHAFKEEVDIERFGNIWRRILNNAIGCRLMAETFGLDAEEAFLAGMLQDISMIVFTKKLGDEYYRLIEYSELDSTEDLEEMERQVIGISHAQFGGHLLSKWEMPGKLVEAVYKHHQADLETVTVGNIDLPKLMAMTEMVTQFVVSPSTTRLKNIEFIADKFEEAAADFIIFLTKLESLYRELVTLLELILPVGKNYVEILEDSRELKRAEILGMSFAKPQNLEFINDSANLFSAAEKAKIGKIAKSLLVDRATPILVVTIDSMAKHGGEGFRIKTFARLHFDRWEIGHVLLDKKPWNTGIFLLASLEDESIRIELGAGWEHDSESFCHKILDEQLIPLAKQGKLSTGIVEGAQALDRMARERIPPQIEGRSTRNSLYWGIGTVVLIGLYTIFRGGGLLWIGLNSMVLIAPIAFGFYLYWANPLEASAHFTSNPFGGGYSRGNGATGSWMKSSKEFESPNSNEKEIGSDGLH